MDLVNKMKTEISDKMSCLFKEEELINEAEKQIHEKIDNLTPEEKVLFVKYENSQQLKEESLRLNASFNENNSRKDNMNLKIKMKLEGENLKNIKELDKKTINLEKNEDSKNKKLREKSKKKTNLKEDKINIVVSPSPSNNTVYYLNILKKGNLTKEGKHTTSSSMSNMKPLRLEEKFLEKKITKQEKYRRLFNMKSNDDLKIEFKSKIFTSKSLEERNIKGN